MTTIAAPAALFIKSLIINGNGLIKLSKTITMHVCGPERRAPLRLVFRKKDTEDAVIILEGTYMNICYDCSTGRYGSESYWRYSTSLKDDLTEDEAKYQAIVIINEPHRLPENRLLEYEQTKVPYM